MCESNAYASFQVGAAPFCRGRRGRWQLGRPNCLCASQSTFALAFNSVSASACAPSSANVSQRWALPLGEGRRGVQAAVPRGSGVGGVQAVARFPTVVTPNPSIKRTVKGLRPSPAAYVKR